MTGLTLLAILLGGTAAVGAEKDRHEEELIIRRLPSQHLLARFAFSTHRPRDLEPRWVNLVESLSGLFCASLSSIATTQTARPQHHTPPLGQQSGGRFDSRLRRLGLSGGESVCTENLTPWKKLLPCKQTGLPVLMNGHRMFETHYHSISLVLRRICSDGERCKNPGWESFQSLDIVFDAPVKDRMSDWSLRSLFHTTLPSACPVAASSRVLVDITDNTDAEFAPEATSQLSSGGRSFAVFDLHALAGNGSNLGVKSRERVVFARVPSPPLSLHAFLGGSGLQDGQYYSRLINRKRETVKGIWSQMIPWYTRPFLHSLRFGCKTYGSGKGYARDDPAFVVYSPGADRLRPHLFELGLALPGNSECEVVLEFERALLRWTEYPPDAHHGFPVPPASFRTTLHKDWRPTLSVPLAQHRLLLSQQTDAWSGREEVELWSEVLLVSLPTPDFSMPYNVICLVCTVVALAFGPIHNLTTKSLVLGTEEELKKRRLRYRVCAFLAKILKRVGWVPARLRPYLEEQPAESGKKGEEPTRDDDTQDEDQQ